MKLYIYAVTLLTLSFQSAFAFDGYAKKVEEAYPEEYAQSNGTKQKDNIKNTYDSKNINDHAFSYDYLNISLGFHDLIYGFEYVNSIHPNAHFVLSAKSAFDHDFNTFVGLGFNADILPNVDFIGHLGLNWFENKPKKIDSDFGMVIDFGVKYLPHEKIEIGTTIGGITLSDEKKFLGSIYGKYKISDIFNFGLQVTQDQTYDTQIAFFVEFRNIE